MKILVKCHSAIPKGKVSDAFLSRFWEREFTDRPTAERWAKNEVEIGKAVFAMVEKIENENSDE